MPGAERKIVLATNIAETSLTIEGVRVVIDGGQVRRLQYDPATGMNRLVTVTTSRASAIQRQGRAGRLGPGTCYRLYSRHVYDSMIPFDAAGDPHLRSFLPGSGPGNLGSNRPLGSGLARSAASRGLGKWPGVSSWIWMPSTRTGRRPLWAEPWPAFPSTRAWGVCCCRAADSGHLRLGADLAALLSERDIMRRTTGDIPRRGVSTFQACHRRGGYQRTPLNASALAKGKGGPPGNGPFGFAVRGTSGRAAPGAGGNGSPAGRDGLVRTKEQKVDSRFPRFSSMPIPTGSPRDEQKGETGICWPREGACAFPTGASWGQIPFLSPSIWTAAKRRKERSIWPSLSPRKPSGRRWAPISRPYDRWNGTGRKDGFSRSSPNGWGR